MTSGRRGVGVCIIEFCVVCSRGIEEGEEKEAQKTTIEKLKKRKKKVKGK